MKKIVVALSLLIFAGCSETKSDLKKASEKYNLDKIAVEDGFNSYVKRGFLKEDKIECGIIRFSDGDTAKYWFRSHHLSNDFGWTLFEFSNGKKKFMHGWFCCEVQLPENPLKNKKELLALIAQKDGICP